MKTLSERLAEARTDAKLSQGALAKLAGCGQSTIASIERGRNQGSTILPRVAEILGVSALWLAEGRGPKKTASPSVARTADQAEAQSGTEPGSVTPFGRRQEDTRPLMREIIELCMGMSDEGLQAAKATCAGLALQYPIAGKDSKQTAV